MEKWKTVITGVFGQDGILLSRELLRQGHVVYGIPRPGFQPLQITARESELTFHPNFRTVDIDITNKLTCLNFISDTKPDYLYNLASHSFVFDSQLTPNETKSVSGVAVENLLEVIKIASSSTRFFQAGSSEMFGESSASPQSELSELVPRNNYGAAKVFAHHVSLNYRRDSGLFSTSGILYNHESPLRPPQFVTRKISKFVANISKGEVADLKIGNLSAVRDWGYAPEYVIGMTKILNHHEPETFVLATGRPASVRDFVTLALRVADIEIVFEGTGLEEVGFDARSGRKLISVDPAHFRPAEKVPLVGDPGKAKRLLHWEAKTPLQEIVRVMVENDIANLRAGHD